MGSACWGQLLISHDPVLCSRFGPLHSGDVPVSGNLGEALGWFCQSFPGRKRKQIQTLGSKRTAWLVTSGFDERSAQELNSCFKLN